MKCGVIQHEIKLQDEFLFMKRDITIKDRRTIHNIYQAWGCECSLGWYTLIRELCQAITNRYAQDCVPIDIVIEQVKQKLAGLRFYYSFKDYHVPCKISTFLEVLLYDLNHTMKMTMILKEVETQYSTDCSFL